MAIGSASQQRSGPPEGPGGEPLGPPATRGTGPLPGGLPAGVRPVLEDVVAGVVSALGRSVEGIVLFGSLAAGGFVPGASDLDLLVALSAGVSDAEFERLRRMHDRLIRAHPAWDDRLDVVYVSRVALRTFKERESPLVVTSAGEPLQRTRMDFGWVMNWHVAREVGIALYGPSPRELIAPTSEADFLAAIRSYLPWLLAQLEASDTPARRAYAVVTACRALHACSTGVQASKLEAVRWAEQRYPAWAATVRQAREAHDLRRRRATTEAPIAGALEFVRFATEAVSGHAEKPRP